MSVSFTIVSLTQECLALSRCLVNFGFFSFLFSVNSMMSVSVSGR